MKILILEFNNFHEEVILSQLEFLIENKKIDFHLFLNEKLRQKIDFYEFLNLNNDLRINFINSKNKFTKFLDLFRIKKYILKFNIDIVILNTYECKYAKILAKFLKVKIVAIIHNADKFLINKRNDNIDGFFVLNKTIFKTIKNYKKNIRISYFYPLINYINNNNKIDIINKDTINIVIPGLIELSRRDYLGFLDLIKNINFQNINFILLGNILKNDGPEVYERLKEYNLLEKVTIFKDFIPYDKYFSIIKHSDLIMPLIHPNVDNFEKYHKTKITAAFTMSFSFKIPMLLYKSFKEVEEYNKFVLFYDFKSFEQDIKNLNKEKIFVLKEKMQKDKGISFEENQKRYIKFLKEIYI